MAEKPILFNTPMVEAILKGRKTQTRRIIKGLPLYEPYFEEDEGRGWLEDKGNGSFYALEEFSKVQPGDVLWVRETWQRLSDFGEQLYVYRADYKDDEPLRLDGMYTTWRPSIHMPREAARIFLRVTGLRAERLQAITIEEIKAEGMNVLGLTRQATFKAWIDLWESTIKKVDIPKYGWDANPWVWVYEFEKTEAQHG